MAGTSNSNQAGPSNSNLQSSTAEPDKPHFFQPIMADNQSQLKIPIKFYNRYVEGKITAEEIELTSDASDVVWRVKLEGRDITEGFGAFAACHAYRLGDIALFRYEGGVRFHVTACGPSCCEIQYTFDTEGPVRVGVEEPIDEVGGAEANDDEDVSEEDDDMSVEEEQCVTLAVTQDTLRKYRMFIPKEFCESSGLQNHGGGVMSLINDAGAKWQVRIRNEISDTRRRMRIVGLREFLDANEIKAHDKLVFKLIWEDASTPALQMCEKIRAT